MPEGWEERKTPNGRVYYVNHVTKSTQWERPTAPATLPPTEDATPSPNGVHTAESEAASATPTAACASKSPTNNGLSNGTTNEPISRRHSSEILLNFDNENSSNRPNANASGLVFFLLRFCLQLDR